MGTYRERITIHKSAKAGPLEGAIEITVDLVAFVLMRVKIQFENGK